LAVESKCWSAIVLVVVRYATHHSRLLEPFLVTPFFHALVPFVLHFNQKYFIVDILDLNLGQKGASTLLRFNVLTGPDMSGRFAGRTKNWCFKAFMSCDDEIMDSLAMLRNNNDLPSDVCSQLECFVCIFYRSKIHTKVNELRW